MSDKRCGVLSAHDPHAWGDLNWCPGSMTSVPPASTASRWCSVHDEPAAECWSNECMTSVPPTQPPAAKCDYCDQRATTLAGDTNGVLVCEDHVRLFAEREIAAAIDATQPPAAPETDANALRQHATWGTDPSGYCACRDCSAPDDAPERDVSARALTYAALIHYGYTLGDIVTAENVHPGLMCAEEQCFDEETGGSVHGQVHDELGAMASVMVEVVTPRIDALIADLASARERVRVVEGERDAARAEERERIAQAIEAERDLDPRTPFGLGLASAAQIAREAR